MSTKRESMEETMVNLYRQNQGTNEGIPRLRKDMEGMSNKRLERWIESQREVKKLRV